MAWKWLDFGISNRIAITTGTWTGNNSLTTDALASTTLQLLSIKIHYDASITNNATVTIDRLPGASYDTVIATFDNSMGSTDNVAYYDEGEVLEPGDIVKVACNVEATNAYCTITAKLL